LRVRLITLDWLAAVLAGVAAIGDLGVGLLRRIARRPAFGYHGDARDGSGTAHLVRRAQLFVLGAMHACCSGCRIIPDAAGSADRLFNGRARCCTISSWEPWSFNSSVRTMWRSRRGTF